MCAYQGVNSTEELTTRRAEANRNFQDFLVTEGQKKKAFWALVSVNSISNNFHAIKN